MLQKIRDKITGWFAIVFLGAIAVVFIFWGIQFESSVNVAAAKVNGEKIPVETVRRAWQDRQSELQQLTRDELPPELVQQEQQRILEDYIRRELLAQRAAELGYRVSDRQLAAALAHAGKQVVLVDADLHRPRQHRLFGLPNNLGLTTALLDGDAGLANMLQAAAIPGLSLLTTGPLPPNPAELLGSARMHELIEALAAHCSRGIRVSDEGTYIVFSTISLRDGSIAGVPQLLPPKSLG